MLDGVKLGKRFNVEAENIVVNPDLDFFIRFAHSCKCNFGCRETTFNGSQNFVSADAIRAKAKARYFLQNAGIGICLQGIMHVIIFIFGLLFDGAKCFAKQIDVVVIKGSFDSLEFIYRKFAFNHFVWKLGLKNKFRSQAKISFLRF